MPDSRGLRTRAIRRAPVHHGGRTTPPIARTMATARRIAPEPPTPRARRRARAMATALAGGAAGLAAGAACVAWPPQGGQGEAPGALPPSKVSVPQAGHGSHRPDARGLASVLVPAADAGGVPPRTRDDEEGAR